MKTSARLSSPLAGLAALSARPRPAAGSPTDWGLTHRFAGSGDRSAIAGLVYDALRRRSSSAHVMGEDTPRAVALGMLRLERKFDPDAVARLFDGARFAPEPLTNDERTRLAA